MIGFKVLTWNIQASGGTCQGKIVDALLQERADVLVLTEFRQEKSDRLIHPLRQAGYSHTMTSKSDNPKDNTLLIAAKSPFTLLETEAFAQDPQRGLAIHFPTRQLNVMAVHIPRAPDHKFLNGYGISGQQRKILFWDRLLENSQLLIDQHTLLIRDFNTGLSEDAEGAPFKLQDKMKNLLALGYCDAWRTLHGSEREYTWYSRQKINGISQDKNGFRLDYQFCSPSLVKTLQSAYHRHDVRNERISDHAMLICTFNVNAAP